jgi:ketosteroid isomerase-like protein
MKLKILALIFSFAFVVYAEEPDISSLVQAEKDFSNLCGEKGVTESFVAFFADDSVVLRPGPVNGKKWYQERKPSTGKLSWEPSLSEISASGELGYNTGPWEFRSKPEDPEPAGHGQFFSFWKKGPDGKWKVVIDHGHENPKPPEKAALITIPPQKGTASKYPESELKELMNVDREFSKVIKAKGESEAYKEFLAEKTRLMRGNQLPESDREKALDIVSKEKGMLSWEPSGGDVAASGDLGYTYGMSERTVEGKVEKGNYVRAWRKENGQWKVAVDLMTAYE